MGGIDGQDVAVKARARLSRNACAQANPIQERQVGTMGIGGQSAYSGRGRVDKARPGQQVAHRKRRACHGARARPEELPEVQQAL